MKLYRDDWEKDGYFWRHPSSKWENRRYRMEVDAKGDLGFNGCDKIVRDKDKSPWAKLALLYYWILLITGYRWPYRMIQKYDAPNKALWRLSNWAEKLGLLKWVYYRTRNSMTRDPHYAFWAAAAMHGDWKKIKDTPIRLANFRLNGYACWKYLTTCKKFYLKLYRFCGKFSTSQKDYVVRLRELRETAIQYR